MNFLQFVKQWRDENNPNMKWVDAMSAARKDYYKNKEMKVPTLYTSQKGDDVDIDIFDYTRSKNIKPEIFEFKPKGKKFDTDVYLVEGEKVKPADLARVRKMFKNKRGKKAMDSEIEALMNLPTTYREPKAKKGRPLGIKKVSHIKKDTMKLLKAMHKGEKMKGKKGITKRFAKNLVQKTLALKRMEGRN